MADTIKEYVIKIRADVKEAQDSINELKGAFENINIKNSINVDLGRQASKINGSIGQIIQQLSQLNKSFNDVDIKGFSSEMKDAIGELKTSIEEIQKSSASIEKSFNFSDLTQNSGLTEFVESFKTQMTQLTDMYQDTVSKLQQISQQGFAIPQTGGQGRANHSASQNRQIKQTIKSSEEFIELKNRLKEIVKKAKSFKDEHQNISDLVESVADPDTGLEYVLSDYLAANAIIEELLDAMKGRFQVLQRLRSSDKDIQEIFAGLAESGLATSKGALEKTRAKIRSQQISRFLGSDSDLSKAQKSSELEPQHMKVRFVVDYDVLEGDDKEANIAAINSIVTKIRTKVQQRVQEQINNNPIRIPISFGSYDLIKQAEKEQKEVSGKIKEITDEDHAEQLISNITVAIKANTDGLLDAVNTKIDEINSSLTKTIDVKIRPVLMDEDEVKKAVEGTEESIDDLSKRRSILSGFTINMTNSGAMETVADDRVVGLLEEIKNICSEISGKMDNIHINPPGGGGSGGGHVPPNTPVRTNTPPPGGGGGNVPPQSGGQIGQQPQSQKPMQVKKMTVDGQNVQIGQVQSGAPKSKQAQQQPVGAQTQGQQPQVVQTQNGQSQGGQVGNATKVEIKTKEAKVDSEQKSAPKKRPSNLLTDLVPGRLMRNVSVIRSERQGQISLAEQISAKEYGKELNIAAMRALKGDIKKGTPLSEIQSKNYYTQALSGNKEIALYGTSGQKLTEFQTLITNTAATASKEITSAVDKIKTTMQNELTDKELVDSGIGDHKVTKWMKRIIDDDIYQEEQDLRGNRLPKRMKKTSDKQVEEYRAGLIRDEQKGIANVAKRKSELENVLAPYLDSRLELQAIEGIQERLKEAKSREEVESYFERMAELHPDSKLRAKQWELLSSEQFEVYDDFDFDSYKSQISKIMDDRINSLEDLKNAYERNHKNEIALYDRIDEETRNAEHRIHELENASKEDVVKGQISKEHKERRQQLAEYTGGMTDEYNKLLFGQKGIMAREISKKKEEISSKAITASFGENALKPLKKDNVSRIDIKDPRARKYIDTLEANGFRVDENNSTIYAANGVIPSTEYTRENLEQRLADVGKDGQAALEAQEEITARLAENEVAFQEYVEAYERIKAGTGTDADKELVNKNKDVIAGYLAKTTTDMDRIQAEITNANLTEIEAERGHLNQAEERLRTAKTDLLNDYKNLNVDDIYGYAKDAIEKISMSRQSEKNIVSTIIQAQAQMVRADATNIMSEKGFEEAVNRQREVEERLDQLRSMMRVTNYVPGKESLKPGERKEKSRGFDPYSVDDATRKEFYELEQENRELKRSIFGYRLAKGDISYYRGGGELYTSKSKVTNLGLPDKLAHDYALVPTAQSVSTSFTNAQGSIVYDRNGKPLLEPAVGVSAEGFAGYANTLREAVPYMEQELAKLPQTAEEVTAEAERMVRAHIDNLKEESHMLTAQIDDAIENNKRHLEEQKTKGESNIPIMTEKDIERLTARRDLVDQSIKDLEGGKGNRWSTIIEENERELSELTEKSSELIRKIMKELNVPAERAQAILDAFEEVDDAKETEKMAKRDLWQFGNYKIKREKSPDKKAINTILKNIFGDDAVPEGEFSVIDEAGYPTIESVTERYDTLVDSARFAVENRKQALEKLNKLIFGQNKTGIKTTKTTDAEGNIHTEYSATGKGFLASLFNMMRDEYGANVGETEAGKAFNELMEIKERQEYIEGDTRIAHQELAKMEKEGGEYNNLFQTMVHTERLRIENRKKNLQSMIDRANSDANDFDQMVANEPMVRARNVELATRPDTMSDIERNKSDLSKFVANVVSRVDEIMENPELRGQEIAQVYGDFRKNIKDPTTAVEELEQLLVEQHNKIVDNYGKVLNEWKQKSPALKANMSDAQASLDKAEENLNHIKTSFDVTAAEVYGNDVNYVAQTQRLADLNTEIANAKGGTAIPLMKERTELQKQIGETQKAIFKTIGDETYELMIELQDAMSNNEANDAIVTKASAFYKKYREYLSLGGTDEKLFDLEVDAINGMSPADFAIGQITKNEQVTYDIAKQNLATAQSDLHTAEQELVFAKDALNVALNGEPTASQDNSLAQNFLVIKGALSDANGIIGKLSSIAQNLAEGLTTGGREGTKMVLQSLRSLVTIGADGTSKKIIGEEFAKAIKFRDVSKEAITEQIKNLLDKNEGDTDKLSKEEKDTLTRLQRIARGRDYILDEKGYVTGKRQPRKPLTEEQKKANSQEAARQQAADLIRYREGQGSKERAIADAAKATRIQEKVERNAQREAEKKAERLGEDYYFADMTKEQFIVSKKIQRLAAKQSKGAKLSEQEKGILVDLYQKASNLNLEVTTRGFIQPLVSEEEYRAGGHHMPTLTRNEYLNSGLMTPWGKLPSYVTLTEQEKEEERIARQKWNTPIQEPEDVGYDVYDEYLANFHKMSKRIVGQAQAMGEAMSQADIEAAEAAQKVREEAEKAAYRQQATADREAIGLKDVTSREDYINRVRTGLSRGYYIGGKDHQVFWTKKRGQLDEFGYKDFTEWLKKGGIGSAISEERIGQMADYYLKPKAPEGQVPSSEQVVAAEGKQEQANNTLSDSAEKAADAVQAQAKANSEQVEKAEAKVPNRPKPKKEVDVSTLGFKEVDKELKHAIGITRRKDISEETKALWESYIEELQTRQQEILSKKYTYKGKDYIGLDPEKRKKNRERLESSEDLHNLLTIKQASKRQDLDIVKRVHEALNAYINTGEKQILEELEASFHKDGENKMLGKDLKPDLQAFISKELGKPFVDPRNKDASKKSAYSTYASFGKEGLRSALMALTRTQLDQVALNVGYNEEKLGKLSKYDRKSQVADLIANAYEKKFGVVKVQSQQTEQALKEEAKSTGQADTSGLDQQKEKLGEVEDATHRTSDAVDKLHDSMIAFDTDIVGDTSDKNAKMPKEKSLAKKEEPVTTTTALPVYGKNGAVLGATKRKNTPYTADEFAANEGLAEKVLAANGSKYSTDYWVQSKANAQAYLDTLHEVKDTQDQVAMGGNQSPISSDDIVTLYRGVGAKGTNGAKSLYHDEAGTFFTDNFEAALQYAEEFGNDIYKLQISRSKLNEMLNVDALGSQYTDISLDGVIQTTDEIAEKTKADGQKLGVVFSNVRDGIESAMTSVSIFSEELLDSAQKMSDTEILYQLEKINPESAKQYRDEGGISDKTPDSSTAPPPQIETTTESEAQVGEAIRQTTEHITTATNEAIEQQDKLQEELRETEESANAAMDATQKASDEAWGKTGSGDAVSGEGTKTNSRRYRGRRSTAKVLADGSEQKPIPSGGTPSSPSPQLDTATEKAKTAKEALEAEGKASADADTSGIEQQIGALDKAEEKAEETAKSFERLLPMDADVSKMSGEELVAFDKKIYDENVRISRERYEHPEWGEEIEQYQTRLNEYFAQVNHRLSDMGYVYNDGGWMLPFQPSDQQQSGKSPDTSTLDQAKEKAGEAKTAVIDLNNALESMKAILSSSGKEGLADALSKLTAPNLRGILSNPENNLDATKTSRLQKSGLIDRIVNGVESQMNAQPTTEEPSSATNTSELEAKADAYDHVAESAEHAAESEQKEQAVSDEAKKEALQGVVDANKEVDDKSKLYKLAQSPFMNRTPDQIAESAQYLRQAEQQLAERKAELQALFSSAEEMNEWLKSQNIEGVDLGAIFDLTTTQTQGNEVSEQTAQKAQEEANARNAAAEATKAQTEAEKERQTVQNNSSAQDPKKDALKAVIEASKVADDARANAELAKVLSQMGRLTVDQTSGKENASRQAQAQLEQRKAELRSYFSSVKEMNEWIKTQGSEAMSVFGLSEEAAPAQTQNEAASQQAAEAAQREAEEKRNAAAAVQEHTAAMQADTDATRNNANVDGSQVATRQNTPVQNTNVPPVTTDNSVSQTAVQTTGDVQAETQAIQGAGEAAAISAEQKQRFAIANGQVASSANTTVGAVEAEAQAFERIVAALLQVAAIAQTLKLDITINGIDGINEDFLTKFDKLKEAVSGIDANQFNSIGSAFDGMRGAFSKFGDAGVSTFFTDLAQGVKEFTNALNETDISDNFVAIGNMVKRISDAGRALSDAVTLIKNGGDTLKSSIGNNSYVKDSVLNNAVEEQIKELKFLSDPKNAVNAVKIRAKVDKYNDAKANGQYASAIDPSQAVWLDDYTNRAVAAVEATSSLIDKLQELPNNEGAEAIRVISQELEKYINNTLKADQVQREYGQTINEYEKVISASKAQLFGSMENEDITRFQGVYNSIKGRFEELGNLLRNESKTVDDYKVAVRNLMKEWKQTVSIGKGDIVGNFQGGVDQARDYISQLINSRYKIVTEDVSGGRINANNIASFSAQVVDAKNKVNDLRISWNQTTGDIAISSSKASSEFKGKFVSLLTDLQAKSRQLFLYWTATFLNPYRLIGTVKQVINIVKQYDDALTEMRKVSDESVASLKNFQIASFDIGSSLGTTGLQIQKSTADWLRLGESLEEAQESAKVSNLLMNVSEFQSIDQATQALVASSQAYKDLDKIEIVDKLNNIGNNFSISTDQLATGLQNAAAVLMTQGNDLDEAIALLTAGNAITQDISKTSAGIRTISLRISGTEEAKDEIRDMGEDVDDFVVRTRSKTDSIIRDYTAVASNNYQGVSVLDANGNLRNTYDILLDIAKIYKEIQAEDKQRGTNRAQALVETLAGKTRSNIAASILQNPEMLEDVYEASQNSAGSAMEENLKYLDSISGKLQILTNNAQKIANLVIDSEGLKTILDIVNALVGAFAELAENVGGFNIALGAIIGIGAQMRGMGLFNYDRKAGFNIGMWGNILSNKSSIGDELNGLISQATDVSDPNMLIKDLDQSVFNNLSKGLQDYLTKIKTGAEDTATFAMAQSQLPTIANRVGSAFGTATTIAGKFVSVLGNMAIATVASMAISLLVQGLVYLFTWQDKLIEKGEEAKESISKVFDSFKEQTTSLEDVQVTLGVEVEEDQDIEKTISNIADKYSELHKGVNGITNENISLTNDEYQQYLDTCNKLAEQYPSLVKSWDSQSNAILDIGTSADDAREALMGMYEAQQLSANIEMGSNLQDAYRGTLQKSLQLNSQNSSYQNQIDQLEYELSDDTLSTYGMSNYRFDKNGVITAPIPVISKIQDYMRDKGFVTSSVVGDNIEAGTITIAYDFDLIGLSDKELNEINDAIANLEQVETQEKESEITELQKKQSANDLLISDQWKSLQQSVSQYLQTSSTFTGFNDQIQSAILGSLGDIDISLLKNGTYDNILSFIYGEILEPMDGLNEEVQNKLAEAFTLDTSKINRQDYVGQIAPMLQEIFEEDWRKWATQLGFQDIIDELSDAEAAIYAEFGNNLTKEQEDTISDMSIDMLRNAKRLLSERSYESGDFGSFWVDLNKKPIKAPGTGTLTDIINDEGYSKEASTFTSNLSEIKTAIEQVGESGSVASDEVTKLLETGVKFDSFELSGLSKAGTDVLSDWIKKLHEMAEAMDLSDDAMKDFDQYIASIVASYGNLLDIDPQKFITSVVGASLARAGEGSSTGQVVGEITGEKGLGERLQSENAEEILLLLNADGTLASGQIQQIVDQWDHYEILLNVTADAKEAERRIASLANDTAERSYREALNSSKEAIGDVLTEEDYSAISDIDTRELITKRANADEALEKLNGITDKNSAEYYNASADYYNALTELTNLQVSSMERVKAQQESGANAINRQLEEMENTRSALDAQVTAATNRGLYADQGTYSSLAMLTSNMAQTQRDRYNFYSNLAANTKNKAWAIDWGQTAQEALNEALSLEADSLGYLVQPYVDQIDDLSKKYEDLSSEQSAIQDNLELREKKGYKTTARDYKRLLKNAEDQKENIEEQNALLRKQRKAIKDAGGDWSDVQDQIESNNESIRGLNSSIFDYEQSIRTSALTEAQSLSSAIQQAMSEMASETGLSTDTILQLKQAFSDLKSMDISTLFYRSADGIKMSVNTLNTLIEAENTLKNNELDEQIRAQQEAMEKEADANGILTSTYHNMENELLDLMNIRSQYFATYQEQLAAIDGHSQIELAKSTANPLDRYNQSREYLKEAYEMYGKGQIGSDDFKAIASYFDINGFSDEATFKANYDKYSKYFTEDATGLVTFWDDLVTSGVAAKDELGNYILTMGDVEKAAEAANVPLAVFQDIIMATNDYGADVAFVTSVQDGREQLAGLNAELRDEQVKLEQLKASGAEQSVIDKQAEVVKNVENSITNLQSATDAAIYSERRSFLEGAKGAKQLWEAYSGYRDDAMKDGDIEGRRFWEQMMRSLAEEYDLEIKPGFEFDQEGCDQLMDEVERELNSAENLRIRFNVSDEDVTSAKDALDRAFNGNRQNIHEATQELRNYSAEELLAIDHADGVWSDGEKAVEEFAESLGLPIDQIDALIIALKEIGMLDSEVDISTEEVKTEVEVETKDAETQVENFAQEESDAPIEKKVEVKGVDGPSLKKLEEVEQNIRNKQIEQTVDIKLSEGSITPKEVSEMTDEQIELHFGVSGAEEVQKVRDYVSEINAADGYDLTVHIDETQMSSLLEALNPENPIEVEVDDDPWTTFVDEVEGKELTVTINTEMGAPNPNTPSGSTPTGNTGGQNTEINASYNVDNKSAESSIGDINSMLGSLDVGRTYITVDGAMAIAQINAFNNMISNLDVGRTYITIDGAPAIAQINAFNDLITNGLSSGYSTINVDATLANQVIADFNSSIDDIHDGDAKINVSTATALRNIGSVSSALSDLGNRYVSPRVAVTGVSSAISQLDQLIRQLNSLNGRNTTFTVTRKNYVVGGHMDEGGDFALGTAYALGGAFAFGNAYASGQNWGIPDNEDALVNEVGQESIVRDGHWFLLPGGPHVESLKKNDIVFNAEQTEDLIETGKTARRGKIVGGAYANGTANGMSAYGPGTAGGWKLPTAVKQSTVASNQNYSTTNTNTNTGKGKTKKGKSGLDALKEWLEKLFDWVEVRVERLEYTIDLYQAKAENNIGYIAKNKLIQDAFNTTNTLITDAQRGADKYLEQAELVRKKAVQLGVVSNDASKNLVKLIQSGEIQISEYDEKTREFINDYKEW